MRALIVLLALLLLVPAAAAGGSIASESEDDGPGRACVKTGSVTTPKAKVDPGQCVAVVQAVLKDLPR